LPQFGKFTATGEKCEHCGAPILQIWMRGQTWKTCADMDCPAKVKDKKAGGKVGDKVAGKKKAPAKKAIKKATEGEEKKAIKKASPKKTTKPKPAPPE
jgi:DNA topoisomerase-1